MLPAQKIPIQGIEPSFISPEIEQLPVTVVY